MRNAIRLVSLAMAILALVGCATVAQGPSYSESKAVEAKPGHAVLYVFREYAEPTAWGAKIQIDGKEVSTLNQGGFTWVYTAPGYREIKAVWNPLSGQHDSFVSLNVAEGETYYVELTGISRLSGVSGGSMYFSVGSGLNGVRPDMAEARVRRCCRFQRPLLETY
jgi:hypothetical protein